jgi:hypothetical protein
MYSERTSFRETKVSLAHRSTPIFFNLDNLVENWCKFFYGFFSKFCCQKLYSLYLKRRKYNSSVSEELCSKLGLSLYNEQLSLDTVSRLIKWVLLMGIDVSSKRFQKVRHLACVAQKPLPSFKQDLRRDSARFLILCWKVYSTIILYVLRCYGWVTNR